MNQLTAVPHPFKSERVDVAFPPGVTLAEMVETAISDPLLYSHAHVFIEDQVIPRHNWGIVRPKEGARVYVKVLPQGGGGEGKSPLRTVLTLGVMVAAMAFAAPLGAAILGESTAALTIGSATLGEIVGGAVIAVGGNLLVNAIAPVRPPSFDSGPQSSLASPSYSIEGARNTKRPFGVVPVVLGTHRMVPPLVADYVTEIIGDDEYLRMLVVWGYGRLDVADVKIGDTPITDFDDVDIETREGQAGDADLTLYPSVINQESLNILLRTESGFGGVSSATRTTEECDEISVDISFPLGLYDTDANGNEYTDSVQFDLEFREPGGSWSYPTFTQTTAGVIGSTGNGVQVSRKFNRPFKAGLRWDAGTRGIYEVRITRTDAYSSGDGVTFADTVWSALRSIKDDDPIDFDYPVAKTAIRVKATGQLNGAIDDLNAVVTSYAESYAGGSWAEAKTSNPADLYRHVLQGNANARPVADARIDLTALESWWSECDTNGWEFNQIRDFRSSVWDTLADVASVGRASPAQPDGKWSVVVDKAQSTPVQHFTPRNSYNFKAEKSYPGDVHALRVRFVNRDKDWQRDERIVYADGYDSSSATKFESIDAPGITDPDHIWKFGRFHLAQAWARPEVWIFGVDFENLVCQRGDLVVITHDLINAGLASGRVKSLTDNGVNITGFESDEVLTMESGKSYGVSFRTASNKAVVKAVDLSVGDNTSLTFTTPFPIGDISEGDLFGFGESGSETLEGLVLSVMPSGDMSAEVRVTPYDSSIYTADTGTIPDFTSTVRDRNVNQIPKAEIIKAVSDESMLQVGAGNTVIPRIGLTVQGVSMTGLSMKIQIKETTESDFENAIIDSVKDGHTYVISDVIEGRSYDIRVRWEDRNRLIQREWTYLNGHEVVGRSSAPQDLTGFSIQTFGAAVFASWDQPPELDVKFGGKIKFRHSPETTASSATWAASTSIGNAANANTLEAILPLKPGTYLARVFDSKGVPSSGVAKLATKQANVLEFANVTSVTESPTFPGGLTDIVYESDLSSIKLAGNGSFDDIPDMDDASDIDSFGGLVSSGTYDFSQNIDLTTVKRVRLTSAITATSFNPLDDFDERSEFIDLWEDFDGTAAAQSDCRIQVRATDDDPAASPTWGDWIYLDSAEFEARGFDFRAILSSDDAAYNVRTTALSVTVDEVV